MKSAIYAFVAILALHYVHAIPMDWNIQAPRPVGSLGQFKPPSRPHHENNGPKVEIEPPPSFISEVNGVPVVAPPNVPEQEVFAKPPIQNELEQQKPKEDPKRPGVEVVIVPINVQKPNHKEEKEPVPKYPAKPQQERPQHERPHAHKPRPEVPQAESSEEVHFAEKPNGFRPFQPIHERPHFHKPQPEVPEAESSEEVHFAGKPINFRPFQPVQLF
ncbi:pollen-specific leucine-rich repeat extensin-like protein 1 [Teleopsis dalmanni]|uniref:pollen-specific leucine-rich repeat extensin-like protein 1 n=1 Tax=Teleopsis dalmanni TaxID=139649 RepID=UPI0018CDB5C8|nr:pollen-specific leucine-rich repeat extensin-like protein 1 [Teleopsis dalmanni]